MTREELIEELLAVDSTWTREEVEQEVDWHLRNKHVWRAFEAKALELKDHGIDHWGAKAIWEVLRFESAIKDTGDIFKLNNNHTALMGRLWRIKHKNRPWGELFEIRKAA
jgi:hypothetical protein